MGGTSGGGFGGSTSTGGSGRVGGSGCRSGTFRKGQAFPPRWLFGCGRDQIPPFPEQVF